MACCLEYRHQPFFLPKNVKRLFQWIYNHEIFVRFLLKDNYQLFPEIQKGKYLDFTEIRALHKIEK